eukprot:m.238676 g.238676  ORF g.238676 m.238676 type:complete len:606 (-) comp15806_c0_seq22:242-2059(-)
MGQLRLQSLGRRAGQQRLVVTSLALQILSPFPPLTLATPVPPPGPKCALNANPDGSCPNGALYVHNASCVGEAGADWVIKPNYHPGSACHGENDPNGPMFYNGVYHLFFQDHVPMQVGGHLATRDFVHWARLPIALWNDRWYDQEAVWTFSATIVDGTPNLVYPGIAGKNTSLSPCGKSGGCFTHSIAVPANLSDPFLTDWTKPDFNPTLTNHMSIESRDPSTAWQTPDGEWRYMDAAADIYSSWDFRSFRNVGNLEDCPDFFPLPPDCPGCNSGELAAARPTHVRSGGFGGVYALGNYTHGLANTTGNWTAILEGVLIDLGGPASFYASKSMWDGHRRIVWGWVKMGEQALEVYDGKGGEYTGFHAGGCPGIGLAMTNTNSLPREVTFDPILQRLNYFPVSELSALRGTVLGSLKPQSVANHTTLVGGGSSGVSVRQSELRASFAMPSSATRIGIQLLSGTRSDGTSFGTRVFIDFAPNPNKSATWEAKAGFDEGSMECPTYCKGCPPPAPTNRTACPVATAPLLLKQSDSALDIAVWVDNLFLELFFMGGRVAWTVPLPCEAIGDGSGASVFSLDDPSELLSASAWSMQPIVYDDSGSVDNRT